MVGCLGRLTRESGHKDPAPELVLLIAGGFGEFVWVVAGTNVPVGVE